MSNILVTGSNGFVGSALCSRLVETGNTVVGLVRDRNYKSRRDILDSTSIVYGDIRDYDVVRYAVSKYEIDTVYHVGAITILKMATTDPRTCYQTNVMGTVNVLEASRECGVKKVVVASSDKAYGNHDIMPYKEDFCLLASDPYSTSKSCTDLIAQSYTYTYGMDVSVIRSGNIFGPGDLNKSRIIPGSILRILNGQRPVIYKGVGNYRREFMHISDVVDAYLCVRERGLPGHAYNVGGSGFYNIFETVQMIIEEMGTDLQPEVIEKDFIEIKNQWLDAKKLEELGWKCNYPLREGIRDSIPFYKEYNENPTKFYWAV